MRIKDKVLDIIIQNLKLLAMMKRRIHFTMLIFIPPVGALHLILIISKTYNKGYDMKVDMPEFEGKIQLDDFVDWLTTIK